MKYIRLVQSLVLLLFVSILLFPCKVYSNANYYSINYTTTNGLSQNDVNCLLQDSDGYIWLGTNDGLNRYDGYTFKKYGFGYNGLNSVLIEGLKEDYKGDVWISTADNGIYMYNRSSDDFLSMHEIFPDYFSEYERCGFLDISEDNFLWTYSETTDKIIKINCDIESKQISVFSPKKILKDASNKVRNIYTIGSVAYFTTANSTYCITPINDSVKLEKVFDKPLEYIVTLDNDINVFYYAKNLFFQEKDGKVSTLTLPVYVNKAYFYHSRLYFTNDYGIYNSILNLKSKTLENVRKIGDFDKELVQDILIDREDNPWIGVLANGVYYFKEKEVNIDWYTSLGNNNVSCILQDGNEIFISTSGAGIYKSDLTFTNIEKIKIQGNDDVVYSIIKSESDNNIYMSSRSSLYKYNKTNNTFNKIITLDYDIRSIMADGHCLWLGTYSGGLVKYNINNGRTTTYSDKSMFSSLIIRNIVLDHKKNIWLATDRGINVITSASRFTDTPVVKKISSDDSKNDYVIPILEDSNNNIWYGTIGKGLYCLKNITDDFKYEMKHYSVDNGLVNNTIKSILEDNQGIIWISTNKGLMSLNPSNDSYRVIDIKDGLQGLGFNELSACKLQNGELCFGGGKGLNVFNPLAIKISQSVMSPNVTDIKVLNSSIYTKEEYKSFLSDEYGVKKLVLPYNLNNVSIEYSSLSYNKPGKVIFKYKLDGADRDWVTAGYNNHSVNYTLLPPGEYNFYVNSFDDSGNTSGATHLLHIIVNPPVWLSWYAFIVYAIVALFILYEYRRYYINRIKERNAVYVANMEKEKSAELLEMKTNFFTTVSHELRTPLTLILSPIHELSEIMKNNNDKRLNVIFEILQHNGNLLMKLVNDILNFSKNESGKLKVSYSYNDFRKLSDNLISQFKYWMEQKNIHFEFSCSGSDFNCLIDPYLIEQVIYNLLSNAIKHTPNEGYIRFLLSDEGDSINFSISDSGTGINENIKEHLFEKFYSDNTLDNNTGTGIGLYLTKTLIDRHNGIIEVDSQAGKGTTFTVSIPKNLPHEKFEEKILDSMEATDTNINDEITDTNYSENIDSTIGVKPTIMIVDDNADMRNLLYLLFNENYNVLLSEDGEDALNKLPMVQPDLLISDIMMPKINGLELCEKIKSDETISHIPVILLSAKSEQEDIIMGYKYKADMYCTKPFNNDILREMVRSILDNRLRVNKFKSMIEVTPSEVTTTSTDEKLIKKLITIVEENINNSEFKVDELSEQVGLTTIILNKKLKVLLNTTANGFIRSIRLKRAAQLLKTGNYTVSEVTFDVGFSDPKYFRDCFKKEFGVSPAKYKEALSTILCK